MSLFYFVDDYYVYSPTNPTVPITDYLRWQVDTTKYKPDYAPNLGGGGALELTNNSNHVTTFVILKSPKKFKYTKSFDASITCWTTTRDRSRFHLIYNWIDENDYYHLRMDVVINGGTNGSYIYRVKDGVETLLKSKGLYGISTSPLSFWVDLRMRKRGDYHTACLSTDERDVSDPQKNWMEIIKVKDSAPLTEAGTIGFGSSYSASGSGTRYFEDFTWWKVVT